MGRNPNREPGQMERFPFKSFVNLPKNLLSKWGASEYQGILEEPFSGDEGETCDQRVYGSTPPTIAAGVAEYLILPIDPPQTAVRSLHQTESK